MRVALVVLLLAVSAISSFAQNPFARIVNTTYPGSHDFQIGDQFEILITGTPNQSVSVRTTMQGRTDWGPVIAVTDGTGRWSTKGQFAKTDFGEWNEIWTVGGKLAGPAIHFFVGAPCLTGRPSFVSVSGPNQAVSCETAKGRQTFVTSSSPDAFRTPDGRLVPGRRQGNLAIDEYQMELLQYFITSTGDDRVARVSLSLSRGGRGDEVSDLIARLIGPNALNETELRNVLTIIRGAFERPETIAPSARAPLKTIPFLRRMADFAGTDGLKQEIEETIALLAAR